MCARRRSYRRYFSEKVARKARQRRVRCEVARLCLANLFKRAVKGIGSKEGAYESHPEALHFSRFRTDDVVVEALAKLYGSQEGDLVVVGGQTGGFHLRQTMLASLSQMYCMEAEVPLPALEGLMIALGNPKRYVTGSIDTDFPADEFLERPTKEVRSPSFGWSGDALRFRMHERSRVGASCGSGSLYIPL